MATPGHGGATSSDIAQALNILAGALSSHSSVATSSGTESSKSTTLISLTPGLPVAAVLGK